MPGYISEVNYDRSASKDFIEVAVPEGTDVSSYTIVVYNSDGTVESTYSFGSIESTVSGDDVYLFDKSILGFIKINSGDAIALVDDSGNVIQFISFDGNTVTATEGPADGLTSTSIGTSGKDESLQSDDDGATYYVHSSPNPGTVPCFALHHDRHARWVAGG